MGQLCMLRKGFRLEFAAEPDSIVMHTVKTPVFFMFFAAWKSVCKAELHAQCEGMAEAGMLCTQFTDQPFNL